MNRFIEVVKQENAELDDLDLLLEEKKIESDTHAVKKEQVVYKNRYKIYFILNNLK